jgi:autotransporter passenger strand-loop-strand repeat protein
VDYGSEIVSSGGSTVDTSILAGQETLSSGGVATSAFINSGGVQYVRGGTTYDTDIGYRAEEIVYAGVASDTLVSYDGGLYVSGGAADGATVQEGGLDVISGVISNTVASDESVVALARGAISYNTMLSGNPYAQGTTETVYSGAVAHGTTVYNGAGETADGGKTYGTVVSSGGEQYAVSGGISYDTLIFTSGYVSVADGGTESAASIDGGVLGVGYGGVLAGGVDFLGSSGQLEIATTVMPTTVISGFGPGDSIDLLMVAYSSASTVSVNSPGVVTVSAGGTTYNLNISGAVVGATNFSLSSAAYGGTMLTDPLAGSDVARIGPELSAFKMTFLTPVNGGVASASAPPIADLFAPHDNAPANHGASWPASSDPLWGTTSASIIGGSQIAHLAAAVTRSTLSLPAMSGTG